MHRLSEPTPLIFRFHRPYAMLQRRHFQKVAGPWRGSTLLKPFLAIAALGILCWIRARTAQHLEASSFTPTAQKVRTHVTLASIIADMLSPTNNDHFVCFTFKGWTPGLGERLPPAGAHAIHGKAMAIGAGTFFAQLFLASGSPYISAYSSWKPSYRH